MKENQPYWQFPTQRARFIMSEKSVIKKSLLYALLNIKSQRNYVVQVSLPMHWKNIQTSELGHWKKKLGIFAQSTDGWLWFWEMDLTSYRFRLFQGLLAQSIQTLSLSCKQTTLMEANHFHPVQKPSASESRIKLLACPIALYMKPPEQWISSLEPHRCEIQQFGQLRKDPYRQRD